MFLQLPGFSSKEVKYFVALKSMTLKKKKNPPPALRDCPLHGSPLLRFTSHPLPRWIGGGLLPSFPLLSPQSPEGDSSHKHIFCELTQPTLKTGQSSGEFLPREAERT